VESVLDIIMLEPANEAQTICFYQIVFPQQKIA
jgi:hypothetical protein